MAQVMQVNNLLGKKGEEAIHAPAPQGVEEWMTKLRGMSVADKDKVIDTLMSQEGF